MRLALRVEVGTELGAREGVPALLRLFDEYQLKASFCISLGPDFTHYPLASQLPGWLRRRLPVPAIGNKHKANLLAIAHAGHDVGIAGYSAAEWQRNVAYRTSEWVHSEVQYAVEAFHDLFGKAPRYHGAVGWQAHPQLLSEETSYGFDFASDVRGHHAFLPELQGVRSSCPQIPTTLPTLDELLTRREINHDNLHQYLYAACQRIMPNGEVFTLSAEREGRELLPMLERLLVMWKGGQWEIRSLCELCKRIGETHLDRHLIGWGTTEGRGQHVVMQSTVLESEKLL